MMNPDLVPDNDYLLLTPGPLSTSKRVRAAMLQDWCTWDDSYNQLTQQVRSRLVELAGSDEYVAVPMQGSGSFVVESLLGSVVGPDHALLVLANGAYGRRIGQICQVLGISHHMVDVGDVGVVDAEVAHRGLAEFPQATHVAVVHCETTTGVLNPLDEVAPVVTASGRKLLVDAMSSFGGVPIDLAGLGIDHLVSSANKCIQGVPGFGFVLSRRTELEQVQHAPRSLALDLVGQWRAMEQGEGKWRFTSPTHVVHAFAEALTELAEEGGVEARHDRLARNQVTLVEGLAALGLHPVVERRFQSPVITAFRYPEGPFDFAALYQGLKREGFVIYPGKVSQLVTFRVGTIGDVQPADIDRLCAAFARLRHW
ncbi:2-aminoethylphosphonate--pyruvate transaminase [Luteococcus sp. OSA5]|uniref:2-aminoethylphosphonate--pyruvate transaminase n=1 Tax=Luteococcus sp. OSA5 TaxID=3401630 RepID=UPI003B43B312